MPAGKRTVRCLSSRPVRRLLLVLPAIAVAVVVVSACTSAGTPASDVTITATVTHTRPAPTPAFTPEPTKSVVPLPPGVTPAKGEVEKPCPYIAATPADNPDVNVADIEGDHVYRTTVLTGLSPVGCRFYFYAGPFEAIADIVPRLFATAADAHNAMVLTAKAGGQPLGQPGIAKGVDAVQFRTKFFGPDGSRDWACAFAKGRVMVIVHTQRTDEASSALYLAQAIAAKF